eukprot:1629162-Pyramimonas_sp.AAC.1
MWGTIFCQTATGQSRAPDARASQSAAIAHRRRQTWIDGLGWVGWIGCDKIRWVGLQGMDWIKQDGLYWVDWIGWERSRWLDKILRI